jgi:hypothetical protein
MTPKEKAIEIYNKFRNENSIMTANIRAKKQALICVDEILESCYLEKEWFFEEVKEEINKL